ncbi:MAG: histone deacetylase [Candidatus Diapherotrites archaeon]|nr:histone deacetylase [Candidatus Diapherotrites archaeon]
MEIVFHPAFAKHRAPQHPENPERLALTDTKDCVEAPDGEKYLPLVHDKEYIARIKNMFAPGDTGSGPNEKESVAEPVMQQYLDADTYIAPGSYKAACFAAGAAVKASEINGFALCRPPSHHAPFGGFCLFNNIVIAAKALRKKTAIIDFDAHHGNGTQAAVLGDKKFLYFSTHQSPLYPGSGLESEGNCWNYPLKAGSGDKEFLAALKDFLPKLEEFAPHAVAVSAGFDSYYKDYGWLANLRLTKKSLRAVCDTVKTFDKHFFVLEGGYNPESVRDGVECITTYL